VGSPVVRMRMVTNSLESTSLAMGMTLNLQEFSASPRGSIGICCLPLRF